jgi:hypothetical protein
MMGAEIEYVKFTGLHYSPIECLPCESGYSLPGAGRCSVCEANFYMDKMSG